MKAIRACVIRDAFLLACLLAWMVAWLLGCLVAYLLGCLLENVSSTRLYDEIRWTPREFNDTLGYQIYLLCMCVCVRVCITMYPVRDIQERYTRKH